MAAPWTGVQECLEHSVAGTDFVAFDSVNSGTIGPTGGGPQYSVGAGGQAANKWRPGVRPVASAKCELQTLGLLDNLVPAGVGTLPAIIEKIQGGPLVDTNAARLMEDCYLTGVKLSCAMDGILLVEYDWGAMTDVPSTIAAPEDKQTPTVFAWHDMDIEFLVAPYRCMSWEVEFTNGVRFLSSLDLKTAGIQRLPDLAVPGNFQARMGATVAVPIAVTNDFYADYPDVLSFKVIALNSDATPHTFTLDMTGGLGLDMTDGQPVEIVRGEEDVLFKIGGTSTPNDFAIVSFDMDEGEA
jgi:hypothetical protein